MTRRIRHALQSAVAAAGALTVPKPDVAACDRAVGMTLRESRLFRVVDAAGALCRRAWLHARTRTVLLRLAAEWTAWSGPERVRAAGVSVAVAGLTAVLAEIAGPRPAAALAWVLPAGVAALGLLASIAAGTLARAMAGKIS